MSLKHCRLTYRAGSGLPQAKAADPLWGTLQATVCVAHHSTVSPTPSQGSAGLGTTRHPSTLEWTQPPPRAVLGANAQILGERELAMEKP